LTTSLALSSLLSVVAAAGSQRPPSTTATPRDMLPREFALFFFDALT
jgi:hypothetical protein